MKNGTSKWKWLQAMLLLAMLAITGLSQADPAQYPIFLQNEVKPNIMLTVDNSGSMEWSTITGTDGLAGYDSGKYYAGTSSGDTDPPLTKRAHYSSDWNQLYYNPNIRYEPGVNYAGTSLGDSSPTAARIDPFSTTNTSTVNIAEACYTPVVHSLPFYDKDSFSANTTNCRKVSGNYNHIDWKTRRARYAFYYEWDKATDLPDYSCPSTLNPQTSSGPQCANGINTNSAVVQVFNTAFPTRIEILPERAPFARKSTRTDCSVSGSSATCTYQQEIQNFANWFSYYRTRILMAKSAMGRVFAKVDSDLTATPRFRVGLNFINNNGANNTTASDGDYWLTIRHFDSTQKQSFFSKLYKVSPNGGTPLRYQMSRIGKLFTVTNDAQANSDGALANFSYSTENPYYANNPSDKTVVYCRPNFHILTTDGYWNGAGPISSVGNTDGSCSTGNSCYSTRTFGAYDGNAAADTLADLALYFYKTDLGTSASLTNKVAPDAGEPSGIDEDLKRRQRVVTYTVGLGANGTLAYRSDYDTATSGDFYAITQGTKNWPEPQNDRASALDDLWHAAVNGRGRYYKASNPTELVDGLTDAIRRIAQVTRTAAAETATSTAVTTGTVQFEPSFQSSIWTGTIRAYEITVAADGTESWALKWDAAEKLPPYAPCSGSLSWPNCRNIATMNGTTPVNFVWSDLSTSQKTLLNGTGTDGESVLSYLRGDATNEKTNGGAYRNRQTKLGDIINSAPLYIKYGTDQGYSSLPSIGSAYDAFLTTKSSRTPMIYVGANDGMLHAFDATINGAQSGIERFAYVPKSVYSNLKLLSSDSYDHRYYVDGQMTEGDAYLGGSWKTVLLGSTGAGAKSIFAIDITTPTLLSKNSVMWEKSGSDDADLGYVMGESWVGMLTNNTWVAIVGNGYSSTNGTAKLLLKNLSDGSAYQTIAPDNTITANGLSSPVFVYDSLNRVKIAYAGDLKGNLWKFDLTTPTAPVVTKIFTTRTGQPIIQRPVYRQHPRGGYIVMFGTGKYFDSTDASDTTVQSLYGIWDKPDGTAHDLVYTSLQAQTLTAVTGGATVTSNAVDWDNQYGWYVNLSLNFGERAVANPKILEDVFVIKTLVPSGALCSAGGDSYLYGINYLNGGANNPPSFGSLDIVKLSGGGTAGLQVVQKDGKVYARTPSFEKQPGAVTEKELFTRILAGFRTWRQVPVTY